MDLQPILISIRIVSVRFFGVPDSFGTTVAIPLIVLIGLWPLTGASRILLHCEQNSDLDFSPMLAPSAFSNRTCTGNGRTISADVVPLNTVRLKH